MEQDREAPPPRPGFARLGLHRPEPKQPDLSVLLGEIDLLRTSLQTDLSLAAAAVDADAVPLAEELLDGDLRALHGFEDRALDHLTLMADVERARRVRDREEEAAVVAPAVPIARGGRRRRLLPAGPLLVAAAALLGFAAGVVPERVVPPPAPLTSTAAEASYELSRLVLEGAPSHELRQAAEELHTGVVEMIVTSEGNPAAAAEAMMLLQYSNEVLVLAGDQGSLQGVLAQGRDLTEQLRGALTPGGPGVVPELTGRPPALAPQPLRRLESPVLPSSAAVPSGGRSSRDRLSQVQTVPLSPVVDLRSAAPAGTEPHSADGPLGHVR